MQFHSAAKIAGSNPVEWMENADRWIVGFLEKFEEGCHMMVSKPQGIFRQFANLVFFFCPNISCAWFGVVNWTGNRD